jgi:hypothetical protein
MASKLRRPPLFSYSDGSICLSSYPQYTTCKVSELLHNNWAPHWTFFLFIWRIRFSDLLPFRLNPKQWILQTGGKTPWTGISPSQGRNLHRTRKQRKPPYMHAPSESRTHDLSVQTGEDSYCLRAQGHCDRLTEPLWWKSARPGEDGA